MKLKPVALGLASGIVWGVGLALITLWAGYRGHGAVLVKLGGYLPGYAVSPAGAMVGALWGFADAFLGAVALAWLYNRFAKA